MTHTMPLLELNSISIPYISFQLFLNNTFEWFTLGYEMVLPTKIQFHS